jgi:hypothetical protein
MLGNRGIDNPDPDPHLWIPHFPECFSAFSAILSVSLLFVLDRQVNYSTHSFYQYSEPSIVVTCEDTQRADQKEWGARLGLE